MKAKARKIKPGHEYDRLFPKSLGIDTVVQEEGKAKLHHTINLIKEMVDETNADTALIAPLLRGRTIRETCRNIWNFVYNHIQYKPDLKGIEQVRRPSRIWAERFIGCDCDCMTVMICCLLKQLKIDHEIRISKYLDKKNLWRRPRYQHIYPIVPLNNGKYITIDCVTDFFDYEVPVYGKKDFKIGDNKLVGTIEGTAVSGFNGADSLAVREIVMITKKGKDGHRVEKECGPKNLNVLPIKEANVNLLANRQYGNGNLSPSLTFRDNVVINNYGHHRKNKLRGRPRDLQTPDGPMEMRNVKKAPKKKLIRLRKHGIFEKILIATAVGVGTYHAVRLLTNTKG